MSLASMRTLLLQQTAFSWTRLSSLSTLANEIARFDSDCGVTVARTPPGSWYVNEGIYELEKSTVFAKNWVSVNGAHHLNKPGDFITGFLGDEPYLIGKDTPDRIHYFYNICRHHGTLLCDAPKGFAKEYVCPYHAWKYALDGRLTGAKRLKGIEDFSVRNYGLKKFSGTNWFGSLFLNQDTEADVSQFHHQMEELRQRLKALGCEEDKLTHVGSKTFPLNCNWKVVIDNYLDGGYHVPVCHTGLNDLLENGTYSTEVYDGFSIQTTGGNNSDSRVGTQSLYAHIYPNLFINRYGNWLDINYVLPTGPQTCDVLFDWFLDTDFHDGLDETERKKLIAESLADSIKVQEEDTEICERVQKGMRSKTFVDGRYSPRLEHAMYDFHCRLAKDYNSHV